MARLSMARPAAFLAAIAVALVGCGGAPDAVNPALSAGLTGRGPIMFVMGVDNSHVVGPLIAQWNMTHPDERATLVERPDRPDQQHDDLAQHVEDSSARYDVVTVDAVWTAEFAAQGWIQPLAGPMAVDTTAMLSAPSRPRPTTAPGTRHRSPAMAASCTTAGISSPRRRRPGPR